MTILLTLLVFLVLFDHFYKNKRIQLLFYKNDHRFSVIVAIRFYHQGLEHLFDIARQSKHEYIFVNINNAIVSEDYGEFIIHDLLVDNDPSEQAYTIEILSKAYQKGYPSHSHPFLLFMDAHVMIEKLPMLDFMANNLVEHQLYTAKETVIHQTAEEGHLLFFDLLRDVNLPNDAVNYHFFAIKNETYCLNSCPTKVYKTTEAFEYDMNKKNVTVMHIDHGGGLTYTTNTPKFKQQVWHMMDYIVHHDRLLGIGRMLLIMLAFHLFYAMLIFDQLTSDNFVVSLGINVVLYAVVHVALYLSIRISSKHHFLSFIMAPFYLLWFDGILAIGLIKRAFHTRQKSLEVFDGEQKHDE
ncbi:MAG: hypothetical protein ACOCU2_02090 [Bacillota bacterium]